MRMMDYFIAALVGDNGVKERRIWEYSCRPRCSHLFKYRVREVLTRYRSVGNVARKIVNAINSLGTNRRGAKGNVHADTSRLLIKQYSIFLFLVYIYIRKKLSLRINGL